VLIIRQNMFVKEVKHMLWIFLLTNSLVSFLSFSSKLQRV